MRKFNLKLVSSTLLVLSLSGALFLPGCTADEPGVVTKTVTVPTTVTKTVTDIVTTTATAPPVTITKTVAEPTVSPTPTHTFIAISSKGPTLDAEVEPNFGVSEWFIIVDTETMEFDAIEGIGVTKDGGAGEATAEQIVNTGVEVVLTGSCGSKAEVILSSAGIIVITGVSGTVEDVINKYKLGEY